MSSNKFRLVLDTPGTRLLKVSGPRNIIGALLLVAATRVMHKEAWQEFRKLLAPPDQDLEAERALARVPAVPKGASGPRLKRSNRPTRPQASVIGAHDAKW